MKSSTGLFRWPLIATLAALLTPLSAAVADVQDSTMAAAQAMQKGPEATPFRTITNFSSALRCMDNLMITYGVRDVSMLVEELTDKTQKVQGGSKDMLISAMSDMTRRSRAVRLIAFGQDSGNLISFLQNADKKTAYAQVPQYDIRGSISTYDESVAKGDRSFGLSFGLFNFGANSSGSVTVLGLDLSVLNTNDMSVLPGVSSRNAVLIYRQGGGGEASGSGEARMTKFGINFSAALQKSEGNGQALRNLIELATIELVGKLTKTPYWSCLGADPKSEPVMTEIGDWYYGMTGNTAEIVSYFQYQLAVRGFYSGPVDGVGNPELAQAVADLRAALKLEANSQINQELFTAYLNADLSTVKAQRVATKAPPQKLVEPIGISINPTKPGKLKRGETFNLIVGTNRDAYVYCYLLDETKKLQRFFPNRFAKNALISAAAPLTIPGQMRFQMAASDKGIPETVACFAAPVEVLAQLPQPFNAPDFEGIAGVSLEQVKAVIIGASGPELGEARYMIDVQ
jgi:peptidoglycan hydrolase-like protein with peptidoglycan-binding domain